ncbi:winged helix-turn-helix domain-containing protein [Enterobacter cloacae]|uniref:winged helix-turn-helix domain-containing protein n=1 Tax=Enterobacter cloacae TaxID=550 RepID=UPI0021D14ED0|nr:winged helix-turn-helix domain-containing protein [Enterobacter cloacae]MCU6300209.1 winged helix-turn-helix domain-containing protein [Enterobacter cloacae]MEA5222304.1 winged helix-turn-helix domain-containing protein [Enterobacter cloacae]
MNTTFLIDGRLVFHREQNALTSLVQPELTEILNEPCARCLEALLAAKGNIVSQAELYIAGWGESYKDVSPNTLYQNILLARKAFKKVADSNEDFIITVPRQGFRFNETLPVTVGDTQDNFASAPDEFTPELISAEKGNLLFRLSVYPLLLRLVLPISVVFFVASAMIFIFASYNYRTINNDDFTSEYNYSGTHSGCEIYINKRQTLSGVETEQLLNIWPGITSGCRRLPLRYITPYRNHLSVFYLSCNSTERADRICSSGYHRLSE